MRPHSPAGASLVKTISDMVDVNLGRAGRQRVNLSDLAATGNGSLQRVGATALEELRTAVGSMAGELTCDGLDGHVRVSG